MVMPDPQRFQMNGGEQGRFSKLESCSAAASTACLAESTRHSNAAPFILLVCRAAFIDRVITRVIKRDRCELSYALGFSPEVYRHGGRWIHLSLDG